MTRFLHRIATQWMEHDIPSAAASIAFYSLFTLAPTLVFGVALGSWLLGSASSESAMRDLLAQFLDPAYVDALLSTVDSRQFVQQGLLATIAAAALILYGASATFVQLRVVLNTIFDFSAGTFHEQVRTTLFGRLLAALCVLLVGALELTFLGLHAFLAYASQQLETHGHLPVTMLRMGNFVVSWTVLGLFFAGLLKYLPMRSPPWRHVLPAALVSLVLFEIGKYLIGIYLSEALIASAYGKSSSIVAIMLWIYYSSQTLLLGAEVCRYRMDREVERRAARLARIELPAGAEEVEVPQP